MPLFHVPVSLRIQKQPRLIHFCSSAPFQNSAEKKHKKQQNVKIDLSLKVGEEK